MTYYDDFELDCGCRMHCRCDGRRDEDACRLRRENDRLTRENAALDAAVTDVVALRMEGQADA